MIRHALLLVVLLTPTLHAEKPRLDLSPEDQKKHDELMESARRSHTLGVLAVQAASVLLGIGVMWGGYSTLRKGFKVTESQVITGSGATVIAVVLFVLGAAVAIGGVLYAQTFAP